MALPEHLTVTTHLEALTLGEKQAVFVPPGVHLHTSGATLVTLPELLGEEPEAAVRAIEEASQTEEVRGRPVVVLCGASMAQALAMHIDRASWEPAMTLDRRGGALVFQGGYFESFLPVLKAVRDQGCSSSVPAAT